MVKRATAGVEEVRWVRIEPAAAGTAEQLGGPPARPHHAPGPSLARLLQSPRTPDEAGIWLRDGARLCACPDCHAPMSVRLWLMMADCWQCGTSVELTEAQQRRIRRLLGHAPAQATPTHRPPRQPQPGPSPQLPARPTPPTTPASPPRQHLLAPSRQPPAPAAPPKPPKAESKVQNPKSLSWSDAPAWLTSMLVHLLVLLLLALLTYQPRTVPPSITLSLSVSPLDLEGTIERQTDPLGETHFDVPPPEPRLPQSPDEREWVARAEQDALMLQMDPDSPHPLLPDLADVRAQLNSPDAYRRSLAARDPRLRNELLRQHGGTMLTEAAVARGLRWMAHHQMDDGRWSLDQFDRAESCRGRCRHTGQLRSDSAATSLCLLPFLGAGQTHWTGPYRDVVSRGLRWLIQHQSEDGDLRIDSRGNTAMYAHGQGAIVLCEAYAMTGDQALRGPAQRAIAFLLEAQHPAGGWRYQPGQRGDTSVLGWQLMALQSARMAGLDVPTESLERAGQYLDSVMSHNGARYAYQPGRGPTHVMTAEALLCRVYLGWSRSDRRLISGVRYLMDEHGPSDRQPNVYYWYYATQVLHHFGGPAWQAWNRQMSDVLVVTQQRDGHQAGSWRPEGPHTHEGGRLYMTALAVCTLEVYYRHTPIFAPVP